MNVEVPSNVNLHNSIRQVKFLSAGQTRILGQMSKTN